VQRIHHDQQFHEVVVGRIARALDHEHILATDILLDLDEYLEIGKPTHRRTRQRQVQAARHGLGQRPVTVAGDNLHGRANVPKAAAL
jgi:hypothetical protein